MSDSSPFSGSITSGIFSDSAPALGSLVPSGPNVANDSTATQAWVNAYFGSSRFGSTSVTSDPRLTGGTTSSSVTTAGTTFAAGADLLASPLIFTATGSSKYIIAVRAPSIRNTVAGDGCVLHLNLDGADAGVILQVTAPSASADMNACCEGILPTPAPGIHTINVRLRALTGGTASVQGGSGGANQFLPIEVTIRTL